MGEGTNDYLKTISKVLEATDNVLAVFNKAV